MLAIPLLFGFTLLLPLFLRVEDVPSDYSSSSKLPATRVVAASHTFGDSLAYASTYNYQLTFDVVKTASPILAVSTSHATRTPITIISNRSSAVLPIDKAISDAPALLLNGDASMVIRIIAIIAALAMTILTTILCLASRKAAATRYSVESSVSLVSINDGWAAWMEQANEMREDTVEVDGVESYFAEDFADKLATQLIVNTYNRTATRCDAVCQTEPITPVAAIAQPDLQAPFAASKLLDAAINLIDDVLERQHGLPVDARWSTDVEPAEGAFDFGFDSRDAEDEGFQSMGQEDLAQETEPELASTSSLANSDSLSLASSVEDPRFEYCDFAAEGSMHISEDGSFCDLYIPVLTASMMARNFVEPFLTGRWESVIPQHKAVLSTLHGDHYVPSAAWSIGLFIFGVFLGQEEAEKRAGFPMPLLIEELTDDFELLQDSVKMVYNVVCGLAAQNAGQAIAIKSCRGATDADVAHALLNDLCFFAQSLVWVDVALSDTVESLQHQLLQLCEGAGRLLEHNKQQAVIIETLYEGAPLQVERALRTGMHALATAHLATKKAAVKEPLPPVIAESPGSNFALDVEDASSDSETPSPLTVIDDDDFVPAEPPSLSGSASSVESSVSSDVPNAEPHLLYKADGRIDYAGMIRLRHADELAAIRRERLSKLMKEEHGADCCLCA